MSLHIKTFADAPPNLTADIDHNEVVSSLAHGRADASDVPTAMNTRYYAPAVGSSTRGRRTASDNVRKDVLLDGE